LKLVLKILRIFHFCDARGLLLFPPHNGPVEARTGLKIERRGKRLTNVYIPEDAHPSSVLRQIFRCAKSAALKRLDVQNVKTGKSKQAARGYDVNGK
jgi:hypothetical protein